MFGCGCECFHWNSASDYYPIEPQPFSLPSPIPQWPKGQGFAQGPICLGEIEVLQITKFESIYLYTPSHGKSKGVTFYKPIEIPNGFFSLGHYCQPNNQSLNGYVLVARDLSPDSALNSPALAKPLSYTLIWSIDTHHDGCSYVWFPNPPEGYKSIGFLVTSNPNAPELEDVRCVRDDLTATCETCDLILEKDWSLSKYPFWVWKTRPENRGMFGKGVSTGTFFCSTYLNFGDELNIACLRNFNSALDSMPNLDQINALIQHYGPTIFFHPNEAYFPSSVRWFFENGALLYRIGKDEGKSIDVSGSNLPKDGFNDGEFWIDLPKDENKRNYLKSGNIESAELYVHVKPALGGTFTDIVMWIFCPFNGPATIEAGLVNFEMTKIGEHVSDWEHYTLRISNFTGELSSMYFSQHSGGEWVDPTNLEFIKGNKPIVYSSKCGHASYPHPGSYILGSSKLSIGVRNDAAQSKYYLDSSVKYKIIAAEYLGIGVVEEPDWLQYMREWGPTIVYDARSEADKIMKHLPFFIRFSVETIFDLFPTEVYGEEGPTGPKEKDNWFGDERC